MPAEPCRWKYDDMADYWEADCGASWTFFEGGPKDNGAKYCPGCGKPLFEVWPEADDE